MYNSRSVQHRILPAIAFVGFGLAAFPACAGHQPDAWITTKTKLALMTTEGIDSSTPPQRI